MILRYMMFPVTGLKVHFNGKCEKKLIAGIGSDIGCALAERWLRKGHGVAGTFLNKTAKIEAFPHLIKLI